ncbi:testis-expressed protein 10 [Contarinia nasturtii]|uniref:testis-expressed protein 10 n=1 Tax=Contarinia nasturtii TaxID=265458 RepID=UPI0012D3C979|nr:testis-expressed protein 10 [Contarinia nasturtii]
MTRHKKFLKSEKAKIKLKGAKLPKGLNVTKTEFKVRKIVIRDQIKEPTIVDGTIVRSNIKDLLSKLQHHNSSSRNEGLHFLNEIITNHPQETSKHLGAIIQGISQLALDIEKDVRKECFKALNLVFASQTSNLISPFFNIITSYLRCAMTHINIQIQEDSLLFLDCLLMYSPSLVASNSDIIFSCFLDMISKLRTEAKPDRTLTTNVGRKLTGVKWRSKVLDRLLGILKAFVAHRKHASMEIQMDVDQASNTVIDDAFKLPIEQTIMGGSLQKTQFSFDDRNDFFISSVRKQLNRNCDLPLLFRKTGCVATANASNLLMERDEGQKFQKYVEILMPLLFETWMEARPASNSKKSTAEFINEDVCISNEAAFTLKFTIEIIEQLLEFIQMCDHDVNNDDLIKWFRKRYSQEFSNQFLNEFPYRQTDGFKGSKRKSKGMATEQDVFEAGGQKCIQQNLNIAFVFWTLSKNSRSNQSLKTVIEFIKESLACVDSYGTDVLQILVKVLRTILVDNSQERLDTTSEIKELLSTVVVLYQRGKFPKEIRTRILIILCDIVLDHKLYIAYGQNIFSNWLSTLPKLLCQPYVSPHVLKTFSHLTRQKNPIFIKHLEESKDAIIANLPQVNIIGLTNQTQEKQEIINLFFWLKSWKPDQSEARKNQLGNEWPMIEKVFQIKNYY